ncbi:allantoicase [Acinetobacter qingfengensis]|uniref:Probable allantoicase n=1 Tax=Acinetobacter qingfengensis TaxID=1262585 RepID=A0A1E7R8R2_9GAMM|nr:allantoicase [Acinetobacter qingfengensis]KAA8735405.1 allantoicase [Acinetobacter qingfengensis]OEY95764.1 allantoicase [Acinetobacter qingfengensis]
MTITIAKPVELPTHLKKLVNLADTRMGTQIVCCSDEFFAKAERMLNAEPAQFVEGKYDDHGKWMDGWETRRKREAGYDWCIIRLGVTGKISGVDLDTSFFTGNYPASASIEACYAPNDQLDGVVWQEILPNTPLSPDHHHVLEVAQTDPVTHLRLNIYPDGGIARLRVYGQVVLEKFDPTQTLDLAALKNGGRIVAYSDAHFGHPTNLLNPGRGINMGDGWETKRRRAPGYDWCIIQLGQVGAIEKIEVDTAHFKGNFPAFCSIQAIYADNATDAQLIPQSMFWPYLLSEQPLSMDHIHEYIQQILISEKVNYIRLNMIPDGGISRIRLWGKIAQ